MKRASIYDPILYPERPHKSYSSIVELIQSNPCDAGVIHTDPARGQLVATCNGGGLRWDLSPETGAGFAEHILLGDALLTMFNFTSNIPMSINTSDDAFNSLAVILEGADDLPEKLNEPYSIDARNIAVLMPCHQTSVITSYVPSHLSIKTIAILFPNKDKTDILGVDMSLIQSEFLKGDEVAFNISASTKLCAHELLSTNYSDQLRFDYSRGKTIELVCHALASYMSLSDEQKTAYRFSSSDRKALELASQLIISNLKDTPTLSSLSIQVGLSKSKLTYGFRYFFGQSVHSYISEQRMNKANRLLAETELSVEDIGLAVGFRSAASFITAFKKRHGITPLKARSM